MRSERPSTSLLSSIRISRRAGLLTSTSVWVCMPLWLMMRLSTKTGFFLSNFLSGFPALTSFVVYVRLEKLVQWARIARAVCREAHKSNLRNEMSALFRKLCNQYGERVRLTLQRIAICDWGLASPCLACPLHLALDLSNSLEPRP